VGDLTGFYRLPKNPTAELPVLSIGQTCLFKVASKTSKRAINLKLAQSDESIFYSLKTRNQFDTYLPGAQLNGCLIEKVNKNGVQVSLPNQLFAYVHSNHIPVAKRSKKLAETFTVGEKLTGTIIFINPYSKVIYLSMLSHLVNSTKRSKIASLFANNNESECLRLGQIVENAQVSMHTFKGVYVRFKGPDTKQVFGFIPKRHLVDENKEGEDNDDDDDDEDEKGNKLKKKAKDTKNMDQEDIEKLFPLNANLGARIFDFNLIEDMILLSSRPQVLNAAYMTYDELSVGQVIKCKVKNVNATNGGVSVEISEFLGGFIPKIHTSDIPLSEMLVSKKLKIGSEIKCRIVQLIPSEKRCILTAKKTLIKSKLDLISFYDQLHTGLETYGVVVAIKDFGLLLSFLGDMKGILPRQEISKSISKEQDLTQLYYMGQLIKCTVKQFNKEKRTLKLSLVMDSENQNNEKVQKPKENASNGEQFEISYEAGEMVETATILQVNEENQYFRVKLPRGNKNGIIYKNHLSDLAHVNEFLFEFYKRQMKLENLMIIHDSQANESVNLNKLNEKKAKASCYYLTLKSTLIDYYTQNEMLKSFADLETSKWYHGWIRNVINSGVLIEIPVNCVGFCSNLKINYIDELKSSNLNNLSVGQSILVKVNKLFENGGNVDKKRFLTSIKTNFDLSQRSASDQAFMIEVFESFLTNLERVYNLFDAPSTANSNGLNKNLNQSILEKISTSQNNLKPGSVVKAVVKSFNKHSGQIECLFIDDLNDADMNSNLNLTGYAFATMPESSDGAHDGANQYRQGAKLDALILAFDSLTKTFCLSVDKKTIKTYKKNFDEGFKQQVVCKQDQSIKAEILFVGQWFCIVGLKAHGLGRLAFMPLFRNDFTQLNRYMSTCEYLTKSSSAHTKLDLIGMLFYIYFSNPKILIS
jgi:ribosomal protein S1